VNIANISHAQIQEIHDFLAKVEDFAPFDLKDWLEHNHHRLSHILFAAETIWDNCCDPDSSIIELNSKLRNLLSNDYIKIWEFAKAPQEYQDFSDNGGDEDWIIFVPTGLNSDFMLWKMSNNLFCVDEYVVDGGVIHIGAHG
jgi:hypothetical protein